MVSSKEANISEENMYMKPEVT